MADSKTFMLEISKLTPSQLYISEEKLQNVRKWFHGDIYEIESPIEIKKLAGRLLMMDGHTRTVAAWLAGVREVPCIWESGEWDWAAYASTITMCAEEGITSVEELSKRIVSAEDYQHLWIDRCDALKDEWYYKVLCQGEERVFFTRSPVRRADCDIRPLDMGYDDIDYFQLFHNGEPAASGCIEKYSYEFWEAADIKVSKKYRNQGLGYQMTAFLTNKIVEEGKTATCRTLPTNAGMNSIIAKCGYERLYD